MKTPKPLKEAQKIIDKFGGLSAMRRKLGHAHASTVQYWYNQGHIPRWQNTSILAAALKAGIKITKNSLAKANLGE